MYAGFHQLASANASLIRDRIGVGGWSTSETKIIGNGIVGYTLRAQRAPEPDPAA